MRRHRCSVALACAIALVRPMASAAAQHDPGTPPRGRFAMVTAPAEEGALFLLLPVGAQSVGMGQAVVAAQQGSEGIWWNPAAIARAERETAVHHSQTFAATGDAVTLVLPSTLFGVAALSINVLNYGEQQLTDASGSVGGAVVPRNVVYAATYATTAGRHVNAGVTYKIVQLRFDCNGACGGAPGQVASTTAVDAGVQFALDPVLPVTIGLALRNLGLPLQVIDREQADALPKRVQVGARYRLPGAGRVAPGTELDLAADLVNVVRLGAPSFRVGADAMWHRELHVRGGYVFEGPEGSGPAIGLGYAGPKLVVDVARVLAGLSADAGSPPTYLSLRFLF